MEWLYDWIDIHIMESSSNHFFSQEGDQHGLTWENVYDMNTEGKKLKNCMYALNSLLLETRFLSLGTTDLLARQLFVVGLSCVSWGVLQHLWPLPTKCQGHSPLLLLQQPKKFPVSKSPLGQEQGTKSPPDENHWFQVMTYRQPRFARLRKKFRRILIKLLTLATRIGQGK